LCSPRHLDNELQHRRYCLRGATLASTGDLACDPGLSTFGDPSIQPITQAIRDAIVEKHPHYGSDTNQFAIERFNDHPKRRFPQVQAILVRARELVIERYLLAAKQEV
jgi:hypothetical protein